ncbi:heme o synthase [Candidatus Pantoea carbekii]|uniref:Protoheme IX farnesyltransferase n=1 Tax=Candidatus Pantoea carbekii TaxID=1235990 RepID=U3U8F2_9GAMM|nr:heme o synthase [Candidatus Pantoea carbekii]AKC32231.1 protoheme IX farnesyltransferase CyoE [Candidatus Pantoea carbekii]BAO00767.1 CyoE protein [Candidatus Pantoea carbekii]
MIRYYLTIIKPKIVLGNLISVVGGFLLASRGNINYSLLFFALISVCFIIASGCVFNNIIDRDIDIKMHRTQSRILVKGLLSIKHSLIYAIVLGITGCALLYYKVNALSMCLAIIAFVVYVVIYSLYMKRHSVYSTLIGSLSGAMPPVIGYCAVTNEFDCAALILQFIFSVWQIPHSYSVAIYNFKDYQIAKIAVLPVVKGISVAKNHIIVYILVFVISTPMLTISGYTGYKYLLVVTAVSIGWFVISLLGYKTSNHRLWSYRIFVFSIIVITIFSIMISIDFITPISFKNIITYNYQ